MELWEHTVINLHQIKNIQFFKCERAGKNLWRKSAGSRGAPTGWRNRKADQPHSEPVEQVKQSMEQWGEKPIGWDVWHAYNDRKTEVVRQAGEEDLVGRCAAKTLGSIWGDDLEEWDPPDDAPDQHSREEGWQHVYTD